METIQTSTAHYLTLTARKVAELSSKAMLVAAFAVPLLGLPILTAAFFPELVHLIDTSGSSATIIPLTVVVVLSFLGFAASILSIVFAVAQSRSDEAHSSLPLKTLFVQNACLVVCAGTYLFFV